MKIKRKKGLLVLGLAVLLTPAVVSAADIIMRPQKTSAVPVCEKADDDGYICQISSGETYHCDDVQSMDSGVTGGCTLISGGSSSGSGSGSGSSSATTYVLSYNGNGATLSGVLAEGDSTSNTNGQAVFTVSSTQPTRSGYSFLGWADSSTASSAQYTGGSKITLTASNPTKTIYAVWKLDSGSTGGSGSGSGSSSATTYVLSYNGNGATLSGVLAEGDSTSNTNGQAVFTVSSTQPTRSGYSFLGWADSSTASSAQYTGGSKITLTASNPTKTIYAVWKSDSGGSMTSFSSVIFDANTTDSVSNMPDNLISVFNEDNNTAHTFTLPNNVPTRSGYSFLGWTDVEGGTTAKYNPGGTVKVTKSTSPLTLRAVWGNGGSGSGNSGDSGDSGGSGSGNSGGSGDSGNSGTSGDSGNSGTSGDSGNSGTSGDSGNSGTSGDSGNSGTGNNNNNGDDGDGDDSESDKYAMSGDTKTLGDGEGYLITTTGKADNFEALFIDGEQVDENNYTIGTNGEGFMILTLKHDYAVSLGDGEHDIVIVWSDGEAEGTLTVDGSTFSLVGEEEGDDSDTDEDADEKQQSDITAPNTGAVTNEDGGMNGAAFMLIGAGACIVAFGAFSVMHRKVQKVHFDKGADLSD